MAILDYLRHALGMAGGQCRFIKDDRKRCLLPIQAPSTSYCHIHR